MPDRISAVACASLLSPHYADLLPLWLAEEYHPLPWTCGAVEEAAAHWLTLAPG